MAFIVLIWLLAAAFLLYQGFYVIRTGQTMLFLVKNDHRHQPVGFLRRFIFSLIFWLPGIGIILILATSFKKEGFDQLWNWARENSQMLVWVLLLAVSGVMLLSRPSQMLRWTLRNNAELAANRAVLVTTRVIGSAILLIALMILARL